MKQVLCSAVVFAVCAMASGGRAADDVALRRDFAEPPQQWASRPLWFWNGRLNEERTRATIAASREAGYAGLAILPAQNMGAGFMSPAFLDQYKVAVEKAAELGLKLCLYDEYWFPSGKAGGLLAQRHPEALSRRLDMLAIDVTGPRRVEQAVPEGTFMGAVAMDPKTFKRRNISAHVKNSALIWDAPAGEWKVMLFTCVRDGGNGMVNFLDPEAVKRFIELTYQAYYNHFPEHFGATIDGAFYDEPAMYHVRGGRAWMDAFNERFIETYGFDPVVHYPALFFEEFGPDTAAARNALFGLRAELYAAGFPKTVNDWCRAHGIELTGHVDQEELVNPVIGQAGDLIKAFKYQDTPGIDQVFAYGRASQAYKVVSSAAYNWDRARVVTECYGGIDLPIPNLYKEAMDQFAKGINVMVPHAVWYDEANIAYKPNLTPGDARYGPELPAYNQYIGRLQRLLQPPGRHVADIAVLYPITTLQAGSWFGPGDPYQGCVEIPEADYMRVGDMLSLQVRRDFTFIHPEVLDERCTLKGREIHLNNKVNAERYKVFIIPGSRAIHWSNLKKIKAFYDQGGTVIATTRLPDQSAEFGHDAEVQAAIASMFGAEATAHTPPSRTTASSAWGSGAYPAAHATDGNPGSRWNAADGAAYPQWLEVDFGAAQTFGKTVVRESFPRTRAYRIQAWDGARWVDCAKGDALGAEKTDTFAPLTASKVRLLIEAVESDSVSISAFEVPDAGGRDLANPRAPGSYTVQTNARGGRACFIRAPDAATLRAALDEALPVYDVTFEEEVQTPNGNLSHIHKVVDGRDLYFIGNSSDAAVDVHVRLRGHLDLEWWDPHTGAMRTCKTELLNVDGVPVTRVRVQLEPVRSVFLVGRTEPAPPGAIIPATDHRVVEGLSPYNWVCTSDSISAAVCGASVALRFRGTRRVDLQVDTEALRKAGVMASRCPVLAWTVNGGPEQTHQLAPGDASVPLAADTANPKIDLYIKGMSPFEDRYNGDVPLGAVKITGFAVDRGGVARASRVPRRVWLNIGDSIMSGDGAAYREGQGRPPDAGWPAAGAARASYGHLLARHFGHREARLAYGGYHWMGGLAGLPPLGELIDQRTSTISRLTGEALRPPPDVVLINIGENIVPADHEVIETLGRIRRRAGPRARLIVMIPVSGRGRTEITRAFTAYQRDAADARAHLVDAGAIAFATCDGQHPVAEGHEAIFNAVLPHFEAILGRGGK